jgi:hypothetical protein
MLLRKSIVLQQMGFYETWSASVVFLDETRRLQLIVCKVEWIYDSNGHCNFLHAQV